MTTSNSKSNSAASSTSPAPSLKSNSPPPPPSLLEKIKSAATSSRNALGVTNGWGVGLAHSGSYVSTTTRTSCTIPLLTEDQSTHDAIADIIRKKKMKEIAALKAARLKQKQMLDEMNNNKTKDKERARRESRAKASMQVKEGKEQLDKLQGEKTSLEGGILSSWNAKIVDYEQQMVVEENKELHSLKQDHESVVGKMLDNVTGENNADRVKLTEALNEVGNDKKRKLSSDEVESAEDKTEVPQSVKKQKELQTTMEEMNELNKTKGQMVWLLKQVITAELTKKKSKPE